MDTPRANFVGISNDMPTYLQSKFSKVADTPKARPQGKRIIESRLGVSQESPSYFRTQHGAVSSDTYKNPYISGKVDENNTPSLKNSQTINIFNKIRDDQRKDIFHMKEIKPQPIYNLLTHQKTDLGTMQLQINERPKFNDEYKKLQESTSTPFHRKQNQFSDFVERNDVMNVYGHLNMRERPTELKRVKDYSLDQNQLNMMKTIRQNSQPSRLTRVNSTLSGVTPRIIQKTNPDQSLSQSISIMVGKKSLLIQVNIQILQEIVSANDSLNQFYNNNSNQPNNAKNFMDKSIFAMDFTSTALPLIASQNFYNTSKNGFETQKLNNMNMKTQVISNCDDINDYNSQKYSINRSLSKPKVSQITRSTLKFKTPRKIILTKFDKLKEEESIQELRSLEQFEQHLRFIKGNSFGVSNQGSVFFKDTKRR